MYCYDGFHESNNYYQRDDSGLFKIKATGQYDLYVNGSFNLWLNMDGGATIYLKPNAEWLSAASQKFTVWYNSAFHEMTDLGDGVYKLDDYDFITYPQINFVRHNGEVTEFSWDSGNKWNQTKDLYFNPGTDMFKITSGSGDNYDGQWDIYTPAA